MATSARGWETDPLAARDRPLADATERANEFATAVIDVAIARTTIRLGCDAEAEVLHRRLAHAIYEETSKKLHVETRGGMRGQGFGTYAGWLEADPGVGRRGARPAAGLFKDIPFAISPILSSVGTCSIVRLAGEAVGTDKPDHFFYNGYWYHVLSERRGQVDAGLDWGNRTERTYYGLQTSTAFSFADLHANWQGSLFYDGLLQPGSLVQRDERGCLTRVRPFDWGEWIDWHWDELLNPNVYTERVATWLSERLDQDAEQICRSVQGMLDEVAERVPQALAEHGPYFTDKAPPRSDPFQLTALCQSGTAPSPAGPKGTVPTKRSR